MLTTPRLLMCSFLPAGPTGPDGEARARPGELPTCSGLLAEVRTAPGESHGAEEGTAQTGRGHLPAEGGAQ